MVGDTELPDPERVANELEEISKRLDRELHDTEHAWLNAADHYLRQMAELNARGEH